LVPFQKKGLANRSSRFEPKNSWLSFSRGSGPPLNRVPPCTPWAHENLNRRKRDKMARKSPARTRKPPARYVDSPSPTPTSSSDQATPNKRKSLAADSADRRLGAALQTFWPGDGWFDGKVVRFMASSGKYEARYGTQPSIHVCVDTRSPFLDAEKEKTIAQKRGIGSHSVAR